MLRHVLVGLAACGLLLAGVCWSQGRLRVRPQGPEAALQLPEGPLAISPGALARLSGPPARQVVVNTLLGSAKTKAALDQMAQGAGLKSSQLARTGLSGNEVLREALAAQPPLIFDGPKLVPRIQPDRGMAFEDLDWEAGIEFTPAQPGPTFRDHGAQRDLGAMMAYNTSLPYDQNLAELLARDVVVLTRRYEDRQSGAMLFLELPGPGAYAISFSAVPAEGGPASDVSGQVSARLYPGGTMQLIPLSDQSGFVAIDWITPYAQTPSWSWFDISKTGMRRVSAAVNFRNAADVALLFGGVTVTKM